MDMPLVGSPLTLRYLGQYVHMFDVPEKEPILIWMAITWMLKDYGLSRIDEVPIDIHHKIISRQWFVVPPSAVENHPHFCPYLCINKQNPTSIFSSV